MAAILVWLMSFEGTVSSYLALLTFVTAAVTDWVDGTLARKYGVTTPFGIFMDPLADKVLVLSALLMFLWQNVAPVWMVLIILAREFIITSLRVLAESRGITIAAIPSGKRKMLSQTIAIIGILAIECAQYTIADLTGMPYDTALIRMGPHGVTAAKLMDVAPGLLLFVAMALSVYSGFDFVIKHRKLFRM
jgi:CDP-diacylglycerol--glycerol-3-phosphate 3-phosphatidyltransferase